MYNKKQKRIVLRNSLLDVLAPTSKTLAKTPIKKMPSSASRWIAERRCFADNQSKAHNFWYRNIDLFGSLNNQPPPRTTWSSPKYSFSWPLWRSAPPLRTRFHPRRRLLVRNNSSINDEAWWRLASWARRAPKRKCPRRQCRPRPCRRIAPKEDAPHRNHGRICLDCITVTASLEN